MIRLLGYSGLIPFLGLPLLAWSGVMVKAQALLVFQFYSALILGFMAGILWPVLYSAGKTLRATNSRALGAVSFPVLSLLAFALIPTYSLLVQALLFLALRLYERFTGVDTRYAQAYASMRWQLTGIVVTIHLVWFFLL